MYISFLLNRSQAGTGLVRINQSTETSCILVHTSSGKTPYWVCVGWVGVMVDEKKTFKLYIV